ncbi:hypothetical protein SMACR_03736 [Sordaria macrospora]|uniref:WGS project CABT00000000 data, contig 2.16 n=2 Tax=Sordaria macrospora TaxID=5147 RepID=F7VZT1_SORMK|nr:uncharacterized protein SMAC_03736 [Sordaria macrospora k-hell]KAA8629201.1 hypothetical protein SMACR_03736 [Sordaria macrospora]WPJ61627.1 hypothetical protein SMAC4_03736 [Sordaria macrospora]CCC11030.1 unnamed protein product [Sordaria macrospora k-hell]
MLLSNILRLALVSVLPAVDAIVLPPTGLNDRKENRARMEVYCPSDRATNNQWGVPIGVSENIRYLRGVGGKPVNGPGPNACGRIACSHDTAVFWCNDNYYTKGLDSYQVIADVVDKLRNDARCYRTRKESENGPLVMYGIRGEIKMNDGWSVVVRSEKC